jgi:hypothetical protein
MSRPHPNECRRFFWLFALIGLLRSSVALAEERHESFDRDPAWESHNNRATKPEPREVRQDFGHSSTRHCRSKAGEIGGFITPAAETAYFATPVSRSTFDDKLTASGKFVGEGRQFHVLVGFFHSTTLNEWRTPNSIVLRLYGRGDVFYAYVEYATSRWRAGGDNPGGFALVGDSEKPGRQRLKGFASQGTVHDWSLTYDPQGNGGTGSITARIDDQTAICHLDEGHKGDGATFDRFGLLAIPKHFDQGGEVWLDDVSINGRLHDFSTEIGWEGKGNRRTYVTQSVRPRFDFGFSPTHFAGGKKSGELGGVVFRGDNRDPDRIASYADRLTDLSIGKPLRASGRVALRRGISDSTVLLGFFHSHDSRAVSQSQTSGFPANFLGVAIEGPSREGFLMYPVYSLADGTQGYARGPEVPHILPDGTPHDWSLEYTPPAANKGGRLAFTFDGKSVALEPPRGEGKGPVRFDRFGIVTTWIDGNAQHVYFDDLTYTARQE